MSSGAVVCRWTRGAEGTAAEGKLWVWTLDPEIGLKFWTLYENAALWSFSGLTLDFLKQLYYGHPVTVKTWISRIGKSSFDVYQEVWQRNTYCASGTTTMVYFDYVAQGSKAIEGELKQQLEAHLKEADK